MKKLTMTFDSIEIYKEDDRNELKNYILALNGVTESDVSYDAETGTVTFNITYDDAIIKNKMLQLEIKTYLNRYKYPALIFFDKHFEGETGKKEFKGKVCCEFCFKIAIEDLFEIDEIVKVENNYIERYIEHYSSLDEGEDNITIYYDASKIDSNKMDEIIKALNI